MTNKTHQSPDQSHERLSPQDSVLQAIAQRISAIFNYVQQIEMAVESMKHNDNTGVDVANYLNPVTTIHQQVKASYEQLKAGEINLSDEDFANSQQQYTQQALGALSQSSIEHTQSMTQPQVDAEFSEIAEENPILAQAMRDIAQSARTIEETQHDIQETVYQ